MAHQPPHSGIGPTLIRTDLDRIDTVRVGIQTVQSEAFLDSLETHSRTFLLGQRRSGMVTAMFAMRLMHIACMCT